MQQPNTPLDRIERQLERLDELLRNVATRAELEALRKEVVGRDALEPQLGLLRAQIVRIEQDRIADKMAMDKRIDEIEKEQASRADRLWMRLGPAIAGLALLLGLFEFLSGFKP